MHALIIQSICLLVIILFMVMVAQKIKVAYPIVLVLTGLALSFAPGLTSIEIEPELIFVIFLPPLLYEAAWNTSWKDFWKWRRIITSFAFLIVILTSCVIAVTAHGIIPQFTLAAGFLLGGIISPPDAVSATTVLKHINVPKRLITIVEGESLMNDASSLIVFRFALAAAMTGTFVFTQAATSFVLVIAMGIVTGIAVAVLFYAIHRWLPTTTNIDIVLTFVAPYAMYILAEEFHFSGVLAVVSGGLFLSAKRHSFLSHRSRLKGVNVWSAVVFILNGFVFLLIGLEFPVIIKNLGPNQLGTALTYSAIITIVLILTRLASTYGAVLFTLFISRYIKTADGNPGWKAPLLLGWTGMRGVVSLAAALSIPLTLPSGEAFPNRNLILFITFFVILVTLILQGLLLPTIVRWVNMPDPDFTISFEHQRQLVRKKLSVLSLELLESKYAREVESNAMVRSIKAKLEADVIFLSDWEKEDSHQQAVDLYQDYKHVLIGLIHEQRLLLKALNKDNHYNDDIIRQQLSLLDLEEEKIHQHFSIDMVED